MDSQININDDEETLRVIIDANNAQIWTGMPGIVVAIDYDDQTISVQPTIQGIITKPDGTNKNVNLPVLPKVLFQSFGNFDFAVTAPLKVGDEVYVQFASRCIDGWWDTGRISQQLEIRMHDLSDGVASLGYRSRPNSLPSFSRDSLQIRNRQGDCFIELNPSKNVKITTPAMVEIIANSVNVTAQETTITSAEITMNGNVAVNGSLTTSGGNVSIAGNVSHSGGALSSNGIILDTHTHGGVDPGNSNTSGPI